MGLSSVDRLANVIVGDNAAWRGKDSEARGVWLWLGFPMR